MTQSIPPICHNAVLNKTITSEQQSQTATSRCTEAALIV